MPKFVFRFQQQQFYKPYLLFFLLEIYTQKEKFFCWDTMVIAIENVSKFKDFWCIFRSWFFCFVFEETLKIDKTQIIFKNIFFFIEIDE